MFSCSGQLLGSGQKSRTPGIGGRQVQMRLRVSCAHYEQSASDRLGEACLPDLRGPFTYYSCCFLQDNRMLELLLLLFSRLNMLDMYIDSCDKKFNQE